MLKLKLVYRAAVLYITGIQILFTATILNQLISHKPLLSKSVIRLSKRAELLHKRFSISERKFISLCSLLSCQQ